MSFLGSEQLHAGGHRNEIKDHAVKNFPTEADYRANNIIVRAIQDDALTARDGIVSEEHIEKVSDMKQIIENREFVWIIDPLDGTLNFAYGFPFFCVSLGLMRRGFPVLGVLYNPTTQELYCGRTGFSSECVELSTGRNRTLRLASSKGELADCIVMTHLQSNKIPRRHTINVLDNLVNE